MNTLKSLFFLICLSFFVSCTAPVREVKVVNQAIYDALENEDLQALKHVLQLEPEIKNLNRYYNSKGDNVVHVLVKQNDTDLLLEFAKKYTLPYDRPNHQYQTPLSMAISRGNCHIFELLLIKGGDPLQTMERRPTLLAQTVIEKRYPCMETLLMNSRSINQQGSGDWEALHYAAYLNDLRAARLLIKYHPNFVAQAVIEEGAPFVDSGSLTGIGKLNPFHIAILKSHLAMAKLLLQAYPGYISIPTSNGTTNEELAKISASPNMIVWVGAQKPKTSNAVKPGPRSISRRTT